jgi:hypothetical protein
VAFLADMSTASTLIDVANRILEAAGRALGRKWSDSINDFVKRLGMTITLTPDPGSGLILPSLDLSLRAAKLEEQRSSLAKTLDSINGLARARKTPIGVVLDEFQEIHRFGGEAAEWHLRGIIQHHQHVSYVLAGSQAHLIERMLDKGRAFYGLADQLHRGDGGGGDQLPGAHGVLHGAQREQPRGRQPDRVDPHDHSRADRGGADPDGDQPEPGVRGGPRRRGDCRRVLPGVGFPPRCSRIVAATSGRASTHAWRVGRSLD